MAYTNERFKGFGKAISKSSSKEVLVLSNNLE